MDNEIEIIDELVSNANTANLICDSDIDKQYSDFARLIMGIVHKKKLLSKYLISSNVDDFDGFRINDLLNVNNITLKKFKGVKLILDENNMVPFEINIYKDNNQFFFLAHGGCEYLRIGLFGPFDKKYETEIYRALDVDMIEPNEAEKYTNCAAHIIFEKPIINKNEELIKFTCALVNITNKEIPVCLFTKDLKNAFYSGIEMNKDIQIKKECMKPPPAPCPPTVMKIPAKTRIIFESNVDLKEYNYEKGIKAKLTWRFIFWKSEESGNFNLFI